MVFFPAPVEVSRCLIDLPGGHLCLEKYLDNLELCQSCGACCPISQPCPLRVLLSERIVPHQLDSCPCPALPVSPCQGTGCRDAKKTDRAPYQVLVQEQQQEACSLQFSYDHMHQHGHLLVRAVGQAVSVLSGESLCGSGASQAGPLCAGLQQMLPGQCAEFSPMSSLLARPHVMYAWAA